MERLELALHGLLIWYFFSLLETYLNIPTEILQTVVNKISKQVLW